MFLDLSLLSTGAGVRVGCTFHMRTLVFQSVQPLLLVFQFAGGFGVTVYQPCSCRSLYTCTPSRRCCCMRTMTRLCTLNPVPARSILGGKKCNPFFHHSGEGLQFFACASLINQATFFASYQTELHRDKYLLKVIIFLGYPFSAVGIVDYSCICTRVFTERPPESRVSRLCLREKMFSFDF